MRLGSRASVIGGLTAAVLVATTAAGTAMASARRAPLAGAQSGGTLVYALPEQTNIPWYFPITNDANASLYTGQLIDQLYAPLIYINNSYAIDYSASIAQNITYNTQGTVFNVFMNPKWHWSNGAPITAADAVWSFNVLMATESSKAPSPWPASALGSGGLPANLKSVKQDSTYEFTITLKSPANQEWFEYNGIAGIPIMPMAVWNKYPNNMTEEITYLGKEATNPKFDSVVSGPFELQTAIQNQEWVLVPNPNYDGHKSVLSKLILEYEASDSAEFAALKTGEVQIGYLPAADWAARAELPDRLIKEQSFSYNFTWGNLNKGAENNVDQIFNNLYVRQAMVMGMNNSAILNVIYHGNGEPQYSPIPSVPKTVFLDPALQKPLYPYDPAKGKALLEQNGWHEVNGVMTKGNQQMKFSLMYPSGDIATQEEQELLQAGWASEGIQVTLDPVPFATLVGDLSDPSKWEMVSGIGIIYGGTYPSGETLFYKLQGLDADLGYNDPKENALVQATTSPAPSPAVNTQRFFAYEYYTAQQVPALWMPAIDTLAEIAPNVGGYNAYSANAVTGNFQAQYWYVK